MGFFKTFKNEFGKKTGKALGNKLYGAYADDKRVGINRGKLKGESDGLKITSEIRQSEIALERERTKYEREQVEHEKKQLADVLSIELNPNDKSALIKALTKLSVLVDVGAKENSTDECFIAAKSKFDMGIAMLQSIDPQNYMAIYFLQKKTELDNKKKKERKEMWIFVIILVAFFIGIFIYLHVSGELYKESPLEKIINKYL